MGLKKGLGRGFESLIPTDLIDEEFDPTKEEDEKASQLLELSLDKIVRDENQPRRSFDEKSLEALAQSIKANGVLQPIVVVREGGKYTIVAGERRYRAAGMAGLKTIPAIVRTLHAQNRLELSIIENAQREDLNAIELATAYAKLKSQFNLTLAEISERIGKSEPSVANTMRLLNLPDFAKRAVAEHGLSEGVVRPLVGKDEKEIEKVLKKIVDEGWTTRRVEDYFKVSKVKSSAVVVAQMEVRKQEENIEKKYRAKKVKITSKSITITFRNNKELKDYLGAMQ